MEAVSEAHVLIQDLYTNFVLRHGLAVHSMQKVMGWTLPLSYR